MEVYLVPVGPEEFELYCEAPDDHEPVVARDPASGGLWSRLQHRFSHALAALEREYERETARIRSHRTRPDGVLARLRAKGVRWLAERVAEQRLLWRLQRQSRVSAFHPAHLDEPTALRVIHRILQHDADRHLRWLILDGIGMLLSGLLVPLPGPNVPGYYFTFRVVGHLLAVRGAKQGLRGVDWCLRPSTPLTALADLGGLSTEARMQRILAIEHELGLTKLARFFERTAVRPA
jgi:hypothetical protein